jgi:asparagine synthase (glutamine-hydrolysing)
MCGIVGVAGAFSRDRLGAAVDAMNAALVHRGPDDQGAWTGENFAFGMRRLSIIDLPGGRQPMWDTRSGTGVVYNGEVYNYKAIRADLEKAGVAFRTTCDTEVVLQSLVLKGQDAVHDWNGMFAIAAWDDRRKRLLLIRDRIGVKPLYYYWDGSLLLFASEIKALLASGLFRPVMNEQTAWDYLSFRYVAGPESMWRNIWKLPPGHMLEWTPGGAPSLHCYWKTDVRSEAQPFDIDRKTEEFERLFLDSVEQRLLASDVPVGVMLSGGLDSSAVAAAAVELGHKQFHTFSVAFADGGEYSEFGYAREVADHLGVDHHEVVIDRSTFLDMLPEAVRSTDEPLADLTIVPLLAVCRLARKHVKVVLSGEGADEILAGYECEVMRRKFELITRIQGLPAPVLAALRRAAPFLPRHYGERLGWITNTPVSRWNIERRNHMTQMWGERDKSELWPSFSGCSSDRLVDAMYRDVGSSDPLEQLLAIWQRSWLVEDLLMKADKMSMAASLELRVPFLDYRLVEWANRQPLDAKVGDLNGRRVTKHVLRRFASKRLPRTIIDRSKKGFPVPVTRWLQEDRFEGWVRTHLTGRDARLGRSFQSQRMEQELRAAAAGDARAGARVWVLIVLETWLRQFDVELLDSKGADDPLGTGSDRFPSATVC